MGLVGNRTENGARAQAILTSVLCTARQQDKDVFELLTDLLRSRQPKLLEILPAEEGPVAESVTFCARRFTALRKWN